MTRAVVLAVATLACSLVACIDGEEKCLPGSHSICSQLSTNADDCQKAGCTWGPSCTRSYCRGANQLACLGAIGRCLWSDGGCLTVPTLPACEGDASVCGSDPDCIFAETCFGEPPDCRQFKNDEQCSANPLCEWVKFGSPYRVGSNDLGRSSDLLVCEWREPSQVAEPP